MSCGVGHRHGSDPLLLGCGAAVASVRPLAWEPPYAAVAALKRQKKSALFYVLILYLISHYFSLFFISSLYLDFILLFSVLCSDYINSVH